MKILVDTNIILDVLLQRTNFYADSRAIFELTEQRRITGCISASGITDIFYLVQKEIKNTGTVYEAMDSLAAIFRIAPVYETAITSALSLRWKDFEDAVQYMTAVENGVDYIITRNKSDYENFTIPCYSPAEFLLFLKATEDR
ncbi:MAG: PIN domain-containing protein [Treponema sp.]|jgi:predicted nucleic acid-binding protein|nr:PIN domain-containing protein [Treponema sp.]